MIGTYATRVDSTGIRLTRPHKVESLVDDEPFTRCGRRLRKRAGTSFRYEDVPAVRICEVCG